MKAVVCRRIVDIGLVLSIIAAMDRQVTGEAMHEWTGILMAGFLLVHQILNRGWYRGLFRGRYEPYRIGLTGLDLLLIFSSAGVILSGISMGVHAIPLLHGVIGLTLARKLHLPMAHWMFLLAGLHAGFHIRTERMKIRGPVRSFLLAACVAAAGCGLSLFLQQGIPDYLFLRAHFAFYDEEKGAARIIAEKLLIFFFWVMAGHAASRLLRSADKTGARRTPHKKS